MRRATPRHLQCRKRGVAGHADRAPGDVPDQRRQHKTGRGPRACGSTGGSGDSVRRVNDDSLPAETEPPISEELRQRGIDVLQVLLAAGKVDLDGFQRALDGLLGASTHADFAAVVRSLPPPSNSLPPPRRRQEPLEISTSMGEVRLTGRWQVGRLTNIRTSMGAVTVDLTEAEFDDWEVEIVVHTRIGQITVIAPWGLDVRQVGRISGIDSTLEEPIPGFPVVRLSASSDMGKIRVMHPKEKRQRRRGWRRRRSQATPRS